MTEWIESLGYLGAFLGAVLEGELSFIAAVQATKMGYLNFNYVLLAVFLGAQAVDWTLYLTGKRGGQAAIDRRPKLKPRFEKMSEAVEQRATALLLAYRFMYGFRIVLPTLFGVVKVPLQRFALFSFISTLLWVLIIGHLGFFFSGPLLYLLGHIQAYLPYLIGFALLSTGLAYWLRARSR
jgi:membrane protein DedA with SNARE-associated domain